MIRRERGREAIHKKQVLGPENQENPLETELVRGHSDSLHPTLCSVVSSAFKGGLVYVNTVGLPQKSFFVLGKMKTN